MATKLYLRNTTTNLISGYYDLVTTAGSAIDTGVVTTTAGGTEIQWTKTPGDAVMAWISGRVPSGGFTLTSTNISAWLKESHNSANSSGAYRVFKYSGASEVELGGGIYSYGTEITTSDVEYTWTGNVTDTAFAENDRLVIKLYCVNAASKTMGGGYTCTVSFNAADAATGDTWLNLAETVAFKDEDVPTPKKLMLLGVGP